MLIRLRKKDIKNGIHHVNLTRVLMWFYPYAPIDSLVPWLTRICRVELNKIRQKSPNIVPPEEKKQLDDLFAVLDVNNIGSCSAEQLADSGSRDSKPIVDVETVQAVCGTGAITRDKFYLLM